MRSDSSGASNPTQKRHVSDWPFFCRQLLCLLMDYPGGPIFIGENKVSRAPRWPGVRCGTTAAENWFHLVSQWSHWNINCIREEKCEFLSVFWGLRLSLFWFVGVIPEDLSPPPGPDHDQPGRLSFRGLWVCGICRRSFSRSSGHSEALPSARITSVSDNLCCPCLIRRFQSRNHGQRLCKGNQVLPVPAQPPLLCEYFTFDTDRPDVFIHTHTHTRVRLGLSERCLLATRWFIPNIPCVCVCVFYSFLVLSSWDLDSGSSWTIRASSWSSVSFI